MILKQRFEAGRTQFIDIGDTFLLVQRSSDDFEIVKKRYFGETETQMSKDVHAFIQYGDRKEEPLYFDFPQFVLYNDGTLFLTLTTATRQKVEDDWYKLNNDLSKQTLGEARAINDKITQ